MTVVRGVGYGSIEDVAPPGAVIIRGMPFTSRVGERVVINGDDLGLIAATHYAHGPAREGMAVAVVPALYWWHLKFEGERKIEEGHQGRIDTLPPRTLATETMPGHDRPEPGIDGMINRMTRGKGNVAA